MERDFIIGFSINLHIFLKYGHEDFGFVIPVAIKLDSKTGSVLIDGHDSGLELVFSIRDLILFRQEGYFDLGSFSGRSFVFRMNPGSIERKIGQFSLEFETFTPAVTFKAAVPAVESSSISHISTLGLYPNYSC